MAPITANIITIVPKFDDVAGGVGGVGSDGLYDMSDGVYAGVYVGV